MRLACATYILLNLITNFYSLQSPRQDVVRENYATLAAYFNADQLYKALRNEVNDKLGVPVMQVFYNKSVLKKFDSSKDFLPRSFIVALIKFHQSF